MPKSIAERRYNRRVLIASTVYGASLIAGSFWFQAHPGNAGVAAYAVAIVPGLSIVAIFVAVARYLIEEGDEYLRMLRVRQALIASGLALAVSTIWGFLESFGLLPHLAAYWIAVLWFVGFGLGALANRLVERR